MEKGGKGFSHTPKGVKSSLKSPSSNEGGRDDSSGKSKKGRKVQFDTEDSPEPAFTYSSKGGMEKGGKGNKGGKAANGGKSPVPKEQPLELKIGEELMKNAKCLMDCEAAYILEGIQDQMVVLSEDPTIKIPVSFDKGLQYAKTGCFYTNAYSARILLETLKKYGVTDGELSVIARICPETIDEVFALVPSLKAKRSLISEPLKDVLNGLNKLKKSTT